MSRRQHPSQRRITTDNNPYQPTVTAAHQGPRPPRHVGGHSLRRSANRHPHTTIDIGLSDSTTTDTLGYDHHYHHPQQQQQADGFQHSPLRDTDVTLSEDSGSTRLPYFEFDDESNKRYSRNTFSDRGSKRPKTSPSDKRPNQIVYSKDLRKVYPNQDNQWDQLYQEIQTPCDNAPVTNFRRIPTRMSERPQSSMSSGVASAIVHGCGGKCQTFENICYFFLQLVFTMGVLIGVSLCIAGVVLRKSAARNLQVLVYIGVLLALVSGLLLGVQRDARATARRRKGAASRAALRAPIPLGDLGRPEPARTAVGVAMATGGGGYNQRLAHLLPQVHSNLNRPLPYRPTDGASIIEEPGIPWWRRRDNDR